MYGESNVTGHQMPTEAALSHPPHTPERKRKKRLLGQGKGKGEITGQFTVMGETDLPWGNKFNLLSV